MHQKNNKNPSKTVYNTLIEILWTAIPVLILVIMAVPSFKLLYKTDVVPEAHMTIKAIGHQWYWSYEYVDEGKLSFDSNMIPDEDIDVSKGQVRLLEVDNRVVVPADTTIRLLMTAEDVLHNWAMPSFGIKMDTVPGRINETWFKAEKVGTYYGQCSELCGIKHAFMPITVKVVTEEEYEDWLSEAKEKFAKEEIENNNLKLVSK